jgi:hypothetical protein
MGVGVVFGGFAGVVRRMKCVAVRDMRVVRGFLVIPFGMVFGSLAVVSRGMLVMFSSFLVVFGGFVMLHGSILSPGEMRGAAGIAAPRGNPMGF